MKRPLLHKLLLIPLLSTFLFAGCSSVPLGKSYHDVRVHYLDSSHRERELTLEKQIAQALGATAHVRAVPFLETSEARHCDATIEVFPARPDGVYKVDVVDSDTRKVAREIYVKPEQRDLRPESGVLADMIAAELSKEPMAPETSVVDYFDRDLPSRF